MLKQIWVKILGHINMFFEVIWYILKKLQSKGKTK